jgi:hypothetical protein
MPIIKPSSSKLSKTQILLLLLIVFFIFVSVLIFAGLRASTRFREDFAISQAEQAKSPEVAVKRDVKRILLKKMNDDGSFQFIEILPNGLVNIYDANMNLIKSDLSGYAQVRRLFEKINRNLDDFTSDESGNYTLTVNTNKGDFTIVINDLLNDLIHDIIRDIIKDIDDIVEVVFAPTPTPAPLPTTSPNQPTPTAIPYPTLIIYGPSPTPNPNATPTPLPDYMTAPPFKCSDYKYLNRPINISNIVCGLD